MKKLLCFLCIIFTISALAEYDRNKAVPVEKVLFGSVLSVRNITEQELIQDKHSGWKTFGGALIGAAIGNQFGSGSGRDVATVLGAIVGGSVASNSQSRVRQRSIQLVELMIRVESGDEYMVVQDRDSKMLFNPKDDIRLIYLKDGSVRVDKQF